MRSGYKNLKLRKLYQYNEDANSIEFWFFTFSILKVDKKIKLVIDSFYLLPSYICIHPVWKLSRNEESKSKVVFIVLMYATMTTVFSSINEFLFLYLKVIFTIFKKIYLCILQNDVEEYTGFVGLQYTSSLFMFTLELCW